MSDALDRLFAALNEHEKRIGSILKPDDPGKEEESAVLSELVPTADRLRSARHRVVDAVRTLARITDRVEL